MKKIQQTSAVMLLTTALLVTGCNIEISSSFISSSLSSISSSSSTSISSSSSSSTSSSNIVSSVSSQGPQAFSLKILSINDFHGAIEPGSNDRGIARIANYFAQEKAKTTQDTLIVANGDIFQGTALSYFYRGGIIVDIFNEVGVDAMTLGNHEFDWGVEVLQQYHDGNLENGEANFPFLGANIYDNQTNQRADWIDDYQIVDYGEYQVGVIGLMGYGLEEDISYSIIEPYRFISPAERAGVIATDLRVNHGVDFIVAALHDSKDSTNSMLAQLSGTSRIDAILNGHSHATYTRTTNGSHGRQVPIIQAGSSGSNIGEMVFTVYLDDLPFHQSSRNISVGNSMQELPRAVEIRDTAALNAAPIIYEVLGTAGEDVLNKTLAGKWAADVMKHAFSGVDIAAMNSGGIRSAGLPIYRNQELTYSDIFAVMSFDNYVKIVTLTGSQLMNVINTNTDGLIFDYGYTASSAGQFIEGVQIQPDQLYNFATIDFIFDQPYNPYRNGINPTFTGVILRELLMEDVRLTGATKWYPSQGAVLLPRP